MRRASLLLPALAAAVLAATTPARAETSVSPWKPARVSSPQWESHPAFDPVTGEFYFVRSSPAFEGWRSSRQPLHCGRLVAIPSAPSFAVGRDRGRSLRSRPTAARLYFISTRTVRRARSGKDSRHLARRRAPLGRRPGARPTRLPEPREFQRNGVVPAPRRRMDRSTSDRSGPAVSAATISGARAATRRAAGPSRISGAAINTPGDEYEPLPSARGRRLIVAGRATACLECTARHQKAGRETDLVLHGQQQVDANGTEHRSLAALAG